MNDQERPDLTRADPNLDAKGMVSVAATLTAVGLTLSVDTPLWPTALGAPPSLGLVVIILGFVLATTHYTLLWWRDLDDAAREAHRRAWWRGGNLGLLLGALGLIGLLQTGQTVVEPLMADGPAAWAVTGFLCLLAGQAVGYGLALLWGVVTKRVKP
jgi:hypothetical protein